MDKTLTFTDEALKTIEKMKSTALRHYEMTNESDSVISFNHVMASITNFGGRVWKSTDFELEGETDYGMYYGVVYDANRKTWSIHS